MCRRVGEEARERGGVFGFLHLSAIATFKDSAGEGSQEVD